MSQSGRYALLRYLLPPPRHESPETLKTEDGKITGQRDSSRNVSRCQATRNRTHLCTPQDPPALSNYRLERIQAATRMKDETQIPHILISLIPPSFPCQHARKAHHPVFLLLPFIVARREQRDEFSMEVFLGYDVFGDRREFEQRRTGR